MAITNIYNFTKEAIVEFQSKIKSWVLGVLPTKTSDLKNDSGYITASEVPSREVVHDGTMTGDGTSEDSALSVNTMTGATASSAGAPGIVPAPTAADVNKLLSGSGTWIDPPSSVSTSYDQATHTLTIDIG